ncbi:Aste57867_16432 [Aphanomyces stellatus]|uniref:Aste57867_16432 protein n=1 Tax=Aphanomyces stellatus TaxID=120398 RepID=A0A485L6E8_9STRA|nr:hypothetical protein As57867_016375 [Aphanomyces stellatus]VFT93207.1 Aste57867_16432 [Aphanomyces stellatus]
MEILLHVPRISTPLADVSDTALDFRSIIYVEDGDESLEELQESSIVRLSSPIGGDGDACCYARVQSLDDLPSQFQRLSSLDAHEKSVVAYGSYGLAVALHTHGDVAATFISESPHVVYHVLLEAIPSSLPTTVHLNLHLPHLHDVPHATQVARAMEHIAPQLLGGTLIWPGRAIPIAWRHQPEIASVASDATLSVVSSATTTVAISTDAAASSRDHDNAATIDVILAHVTAHMAGQVDVLRHIVSTLVHSLFPTASSSFVPLARGMLLSGAPGIGKSHFLGLLRDAAAPFFYVHTLSAPDLFQTQVGQSEALLVAAFAAARAHAPALLVLEDIDAVASASTVALEQSLLGVLLACLDRVDASVFVVGTTNRDEAVDVAALCGNGRLEHHMCRQLETTPAQLAHVSARTTGFLGADLLNLVREATLASIHDHHAGVLVDAAPWEHALAIVRPSMLQSHAASHDDGRRVVVFGLQRAMATLHVALLRPLQDSTAYRAMGVLPPRGILLTGPSGVGKSHVLAAVAHDAGRLATCIPVRCTDLVTKVVGGTEKALAALFATARAAAPCVLLFDQIESLAPVRGFDTSTEQTFDRVLSLLLLEMDGFGSAAAADLQSWSHAQFVQQHVVLVATATAASQLDPSILRPGRFDIEIGLTRPDDMARRDALRHLMAATPVDVGDAFESHNALVEWLVEKTDGATIGQLHAIFQEAALASLRESIAVTHLGVPALVQTLRDVMGPQDEIDAVAARFAALRP